MEASFWHQRWSENQIGFHQDKVNDLLVTHAGKWQIAAGDTVFVPLCGKSLDMIWLQQQGFKVLGIELSEKAVEAFFSENGRHPCQSEDHGLTCWQSGDIRLFVGDFFSMVPEQLQEVAAVYDRASLIALPPEMRKAYARQMTDLLPSGVRVLLVTMEYPNDQMTGPPFSVSRLEVEDLYGESFSINQLEQVDRLKESPNLQQRGLRQLNETVYLLQKK